MSAIRTKDATRGTTQELPTDLCDVLKIAIIAKVHNCGAIRLDQVQVLAAALGLPDRGVRDLLPGELGFAECDRHGLVAWSGVSDDVAQVLDELTYHRMIVGVPTGEGAYSDGRRPKLPAITLPLESRYDHLVWLPTILIFSPKESR